MQFYEVAEAERIKQKVSYDVLRLLSGIGYKYVKDICQGKREPTARQAVHISKALGFEWDVSGLPRYKPPVVKKRDAVAEDEKVARELGLSYGMYCAYRDTGYLETYKAQERARKQRESKRKVNVIESHLIGGEKGKKTGFTNATKC